MRNKKNQGSETTQNIYNGTTKEVRIVKGMQTQFQSSKE
jgi:hypothetical protein